MAVFLRCEGDELLVSPRGLAVSTLRLLRIVSCVLCLVSGVVELGRAFERPAGVVVSVGGQTPNTLSTALEAHNVRIMGGLYSPDKASPDKARPH